MTGRERRGAVGVDGKLGVAEEVGGEHVLTRRVIDVRAVIPVVERVEVNCVLVLIVTMDLAHVGLAVGEYLLPPPVFLALVPWPVGVVPAYAVVAGPARGHRAHAPVGYDEVTETRRCAVELSRKARADKHVWPLVSRRRVVALRAEVRPGALAVLVITVSVVIRPDEAEVALVVAVPARESEPAAVANLRLEVGGRKRVVISVGRRRYSRGLVQPVVGDSRGIQEIRPDMLGYGRHIGRVVTGRQVVGKRSAHNRLRRP